MLIKTKGTLNGCSALAVVNRLSIIVFALMFYSVQLWAGSTGTASIFLFFYGVALENNQILIDGKNEKFTDTDGSLEVVLEDGKHQIEIFAKDSEGNNLGYVKKIIEVRNGLDTQLIATFSKERAIPFLEIDTPEGNSNLIKNKANHFGVLAGTVLTSDTAKPITNARVFVKGTDIDARTNQQGEFSIQVPAEIKLSLSIVHSEYSAQTLNDVIVKKDSQLSKVIKLTPASMELEEFIVLAPKVEGSVATIMAEEKESSAITNIIGSSDISKKGDSDAAGALKRVTGVTIVDGKNVYVRGLGGRYSNVEMNSMSLPSPDPQSRTVPLDIFPSSVIGSMKVQKSATADIPASFGGGYVDIRTKGQKNNNFFKISTELKGNTNTGTEVNTYTGSSSDWKGRDDGLREIPADILQASKIVVGEVVPSFDEKNNTDYIQSITHRSFNTIKKKQPYGGKISVEGGYSQTIADKHEVSLVANYEYSKKHTSREEEYNKYAYNKKTDALYVEPEQYGNIYRTVDEYNNSYMLNADYNYADVLNLQLTKLNSKISEKVIKIADGIANSDNDWKIRYDLNWEERTLDVNQINGDMKYQLADIESVFNFGAEKAKAILDQPNNYKYAYKRDIRFDGKINGAPFLDRYSPNAFLNLRSDDKMDAFFLTNKSLIEIFNKDDYIEFGYSTNTKKRISRYNKFLLHQGRTSDKLTDQIDNIYLDNIHNQDTGVFRLDIAFQPAYWYDAVVDESSFYTNIFVKPTQKIEVLGGIRKVNFQQSVDQYTNNNDALTAIEKVTESLSFNQFLPSLGIKYKFNENNHFNFSFSKTYIVPDLREFTSAEYFHPYDVATVKGNPELRNTNILNYDVKYSHYFSDTENFTLGLFYKNLDKPIEDVQLPSSSLPRYGYANADRAKMLGFEIDGRKKLNFINANLNNYYVSGNFSYTKSKVSLADDQIGIYTSNNRELQGLSPIVVNLSIGYESKYRNITLSYNKMGTRLRKVGMIDGNDEFPDYFEIPPQSLDFVWIESFKNNASFKLKIQNILDQETIWYQGTKNTITNRFKKGRFYSLSFEYKF